MTSISMQDNLQRYTYDLQVETGVLAPEFTPDLTPQQMLELGVFGGNYFEGFDDEFPASWFLRAKTSDAPEPSLNYFGVSAGLSRQEWQKKGWLHPEDPRGWFQWYCRYYLGRRIPGEDERQIKRWRAMRRHVGQIEARCLPGDHSCHRRQRQAVLQWAYDSRAL